MKDILPIPMQCNRKINLEAAMRYMLEPVQINILISIFKYLLDFTSLQVKSYKQLQRYENEHFQLE